MDDPELGAALDDLFAQAPEDFVGARNALVRTLKAAGRKEDARDVAALRRPSRPAWALNRLTAADADAVSALLDAAAEVRVRQASGGAPLRQAMADLRTATRRATNAAVATITPKRPTDHVDVSAALLAVLSDEGALAALPDGRLSEVPAVGLGVFGAEPGAAPVAPLRAVPPRTARPKRNRTRDDRTAEPDAEADARADEERRQEAVAAARLAAHQRSDEADAARAEAVRVAEEAHAALHAAHDRLETAHAEVAEAEAEVSAATEAASDADASAAAATDAATRARSALADLL